MPLVLNDELSTVPVFTFTVPAAMSAVWASNDTLAPEQTAVGVAVAKLIIGLAVTAKVTVAVLLQSVLLL